MGFGDFFSAKRAALKKRKVFIPYFTLGDPTASDSLKIVKAALDAGADALEIGFPFSDPIADGPVIQRANYRALSSSVDTDQCFRLMAEIRRYSPVPIGILIYYNLIYTCGVERFCRMAAASGAQAVLAADLPVEEAGPLLQNLRKFHLESVCMAGLNTGEDRLRKIITATTGYLYLVAVLGVTGARSEVSSRCLAAIESIRTMTSLPLCIGFGISSPAQARAFFPTGADGIIVGSAVIKIIEEKLPDVDAICEGVSDFVKSFTESDWKP
jgi:tryptophan synthase alpha chain